MFISVFPTNLAEIEGEEYEAATVDPIAQFTAPIAVHLIYPIPFYLFFSDEFGGSSVLYRITGCKKQKYFRALI